MPEHMCHQARIASPVPGEKLAVTISSPATPPPHRPPGNLAMRLLLQAPRLRV